MTKAEQQLVVGISSWLELVLGQEQGRAGGYGKTVLVTVDFEAWHWLRRQLAVSAAGCR